MRFNLLRITILCGLTLVARIGTAQEKGSVVSPFVSEPTLTEVADPAGYNTPQLCSIALDRLTSRLTPPDTLRFVPGRDTTPASVTAAALRCLAKFPVAKTPSVELPWLLRIALASQDDAAADVIAKRLIRESRTGPRDAQAFVLTNIVSTYMTAVRPARVRTAESYAAVLDSVAGDEALEWRLAGRNALIMHYRLAGDEAGIVRSAQSWITNGNGISARNFDRLIRGTAGSYVEIGMADLAFVMEVDAIRRGPAATAGLREQLHTLLRQVGSKLPALPEIDQLVDFIFAGPGTRPPALRTEFWTGVSTGAVRPAPGKVNLVIFHPVPRMAEQRGTATSQWLASFAPALRRLSAQFGDSLVITIVDHTNGYFVSGYRTSGTLTRSFGTPMGPLTPAAEADSIGHYYTVDLKIPTAVAIETTPFTTLPAPDGRRVNSPTPMLEAYGLTNISDPNVMLIDDSGMVRFASPLGNTSENLLAAGIAGLLHAPK